MMMMMMMTMTMTYYIGITLSFAREMIGL